MNLLKETENMMKSFNKSWKDVKAIGSLDFKISISQFKKIADIVYDNGYGGARIPGDLYIVFKDGEWLERFEYDGSECWVFKSCPKVGEKELPKNFSINCDYCCSKLEQQVEKFLKNNVKWDM